MIYDMIEELLAIDLRHLDEEERFETEYLINDIVKNPILKNVKQHSLFYQQ